MYILKHNEHKTWVLVVYMMKGLEALKDHFKTSKFPCNAEEYMPVVFSPPRDGRTLSEPVPITGATNKPVTNKQQMEDYADDNEEVERREGHSSKSNDVISSGKNSSWHRRP